MARAANASAYRGADPLREFPNAAGVLPSAHNIQFPQNTQMLKSFSLVRCNNLLRHYNQHHRNTLQSAREAVRVFIGAPPF